MNNFSTTIENTINKHFNKLVYGLSTLAVIAFWLLAFSLTSCQKEPQPDQKAITVQVKTQGLHIIEMKSFDVNTWQYVYNSQPNELKFTGTKGNVYTFSKTVQEMKTGFAVSLLPDNYVITYTTLHAPESPINDYLDITINESKSITTSNDLTLTAKNDDYLIIADNGCVQAGFYYGSNWHYLFAAPNSQTFKYGYMNQEGRISINCKDLNNDYKEVIITNAQKGNVYHIVNAVNGNTGILVEGMTYNLIGN